MLSLSSSILCQKTRNCLLMRFSPPECERQMTTPAIFDYLELRESFGDRRKDGLRIFSLASHSRYHVCMPTTL